MFRIGVDNLGSMHQQIWQIDIHLSGHQIVSACQFKNAIAGISCRLLFIERLEGVRVEIQPEYLHRSAAGIGEMSGPAKLFIHNHKARFWFQIDAVMDEDVLTGALGVGDQHQSSMSGQKSQEELAGFESLVEREAVERLPIIGSGEGVDGLKRSNKGVRGHYAPLDGHTGIGDRIVVQSQGISDHAHQIVAVRYGWRDTYAVDPHLFSGLDLQAGQKHQDRQSV